MTFTSIFFTTGVSIFVNYHKKTKKRENKQCLQETDFDFFCVQLKFTLPLPCVMNSHYRHSRRFLCIATTMLCAIVFHYAYSTTLLNTAMSMAKSSISGHTIYDTPSASLCEKENDMFHATNEMGQWGIPSQSIATQGATGRTSAFLYKFQQRINRIYNIFYASVTTLANEQAEVSRHIVSAKRFHLGYYIYYRCQMRC